MTKRRKTLRLKRVIGAAVGLAIVILIVLAMRPRPVPADFATVERGPLHVTVDEEGETRVRDRFMVSAPLAGRVLRIDLEAGDEVRAGETVVATLQPSEPVLLDSRARAEAEARVGAARAAHEMARAERDRAEAELRFARTEEERYRRLAAEEIVSRERFETAELERSTREKALSAAEHAVESAAQELAAARAALIRTQPSEGAGGVEPIALFAPIDGVVLRRLRESETVVPAGEPLVEIADPSRLEIVSDLLSTDAVKVRRGDEVWIEQWGGEKPLQGKVRRVEPYGFTKFSALGVEEQRVNVVIDFEDPREAWEALGDGYRVEVRIVVWQRDDVLKVPTSSLFRDGEDWAVFVVEAGKAALRRVEIGERNGLAAEVREGVAEGDRVIVHPGDAISDGVEVEERSV
jgi:HlyD family secretion protein